jgi:PST family polysaccharide transporter
VHTEPRPAAGTRTASIRDLDRSLLRGIAWTGGGKWLTQIISWIATPIIARLLSPGDYGIAGMAMIYVGLVQLVTDFGLGAAIVQRRDLDEDQVARLGGVCALLGVFFLAASVALAPLIARFFGNPEVAPVILALSLLFLASGFQTVPRALLARDLDFRRLAALDALEAVSIIAVTLPLAAMGFRHWALVAGAIAGRLASTAIALRWRGHRLRWPTPFATVAGPVAFGSHVIGSSLAWYTFLNADVTVIGRRLGSVALGSYSIGLTLASIPVDRLSALVSRVTPAILAKLQHDRAALRRYVLALTEGTSLLTFPAAVGIALVAPEFVLVVLGDEWRAAIVPLRILALAAVFRSLTPIFGQLLVATGQPHRNMRASIAAAVVLVPLFYMGSYWGTAGVAAIWLVAYPLVAAGFSMRYGFAACDMGVRQFLAALWPAISATAGMAAVVLVVAALASGTGSLALLLGVKCLAGAVTYAALVWLLHGARLRRSLAMMREPSPAEPPALDAPTASAAVVPR